LAKQAVLSMDSNYLPATHGTMNTAQGGT